jgi:hypothetical protein
MSEKESTAKEKTTKPQLKYIGPNYNRGLVVNGRLHDPKSWDEKKAKERLKLFPELKKYFSTSE